MTTVFNVIEPISALTAIKVDQNKTAVALNPATEQSCPIVGGITISSSKNGQVVTATVYGGKYNVEDASFSPGHLYVGAWGRITQDFDLAATTGWIVCIGWAVTATEFFYEPHVPTRFIKT